MKYAVVSDIHGNIQALEAVIEDLKSQNCEKVLCLGDLAMAGPQPRMAIEFVQNQPDWTVIQGNTDQYIAEYSEELYEYIKNSAPVMASALKNDALVIEEEKKEYLRNLPPQLELEIEGVKILMAHGSPRKNNENIFPNRPIAEIEEMIKDTDADLILCGHTHIPCGYQTSKKQTVVNVGSVGRPFTPEPKACYAVINYENGGFSVEHRFVNYDKELAAEILKMRGFEGSNKLAQMLINPIQRHM